MRFALFAVVLAAAMPLASLAEAAPTDACYVNEGYFVSATDDADEANTVFNIVRKAAGDAALPCPLPAGEADLVIGEGAFGTSYYDLSGDHLLLEVSTGPLGDLLVVDLRDGETVLEVSGIYDYISEEGLYFSERGEEGTPQTCDQYDEYTGMGLSTGILHQKLLNLETGAITETGDTSCEPIS